MAHHRLPLHNSSKTSLRHLPKGRRNLITETPVDNKKNVGGVTKFWSKCTPTPEFPARSRESQTRCQHHLEHIAAEVHMAHHSKRSTASSHKIQIKSCSCFPAVHLLDAAGGKCQLSVEDVKRIHKGSNGGKFFPPTWDGGTHQHEEHQERPSRRRRRLGEVEPPVGE